MQLWVWLVLLWSWSKEETRLTYLTGTSMKLGILFLIEVRYVIWRVEKWARDQFVLLLFKLNFVVWVDFMLLFRLKFSVLVWKINSWVWGAKDYMLGGQEEFFWPNYKISGKYVSYFFLKKKNLGGGALVPQGQWIASSLHAADHTPSPSSTSSSSSTLRTR